MDEPRNEYIWIMELCPVLSWETGFPHKMCLGLEVFLTPFSAYSLLFGKRWGHTADSSTSSPHYLAVCFHNMSSNRMTQLRLRPSSFKLVDSITFKVLFLVVTGRYSNMSHSMTLQHRCQECSLGSPPSTSSWVWRDEQVIFPGLTEICFKSVF